MKYILLLIILFSVYIGNVLGCLVLCETIPELERAKKYAWQVPIIQLLYMMDILFSSKRKGNRLQYLLLYLRIPCKNVLISHATVEAMKEYAAEKRKYNSQQPSTHVAQKIFKNSQGIYATTLSLTL